VTDEIINPPVNVRRLSHVGITVSDLEASTAFYTQLLGFKRRLLNEEEGWARVFNCSNGMTSASMVGDLG
jgi:catechol 2,3-dioxygenase-like lactoylglutathione lyase family enzyme